VWVYTARGIDMLFANMNLTTGFSGTIVDGMAIVSASRELCWLACNTAPICRSMRLNHTGLMHVENVLSTQLAFSKPQQATKRRRLKVPYTPV